MGAWGAKAFENDAALDWLAELEDEGIEALRDALTRVADAEAKEYVDADDGSAAVAAATLVAAALGRADEKELSPDARAWLRENDGELGEDDMALALRAVRRVLAPRSELRSLWGEAGGESEWHVAMRGLLERLGGDAIADAPAAEEEDDEEGGGGHEKMALLTFLQARGLVPTAEQAERIHASQDAAEIRRWLGLALTVSSIDELLGSK